jgi:uncharacterized protein YeaO (DUF488 family)
MKISAKRIYDEPSSKDGVRILIDRLWPRGLSRKTARIDEWLKDVAPSDVLRRWFGHDPIRWKEFQRRYFAELDTKPGVWLGVLERARNGPVTLLYAARDPEHNNAVAFRTFLERHAGHGRLRRSKEMP